MADSYKSDMVIKIKEKCEGKKKPDDSAKKRMDLSSGKQFYVFKTTKKGGKTWYKISDPSSDDTWVSSKYCKLLTQQQTKKAESSGLINTANAQYEGNGGKGLKSAKDLDNQMKKLVATKRNTLASNIDGSMRMFGMPHQMTPETDKRISDKTDLGTVFTEHFIADAPVIYLKPGKSNFLPGMSNSEKRNMVNAIINSAKGDSKSSSLAAKLSGMKDNDWRYFDFKEDYASYVRNVNTLCRLCSVFLKLNDKDVPWQTGKATYGTYDWSGYTFETLYNNKTTVNAKPASGIDPTKESTSLLDKVLSFGNSVKTAAKSAVATLLSDDNFVRFYVDASVGFQESVSNTTTQSMINSYIDSMESIGKELSFVSGATGIDIDQVVNKSADRIDAAANKILSGDGAISNFMKRLTGTGKQVLAGANFIAPEIWSSASYSKSYSFSITLSTPYGNVESWYLDICVPLMHLLAMSLPRQNTANTYNAPFLVRAYSPGWFSCDLGVIESLTIDKAPSGDAWGQNSLPLEVKIGVNIKELYSSLALPEGGDFKVFFANTGLMNYLMINCGVDITKQTLDLQVTVFTNIFQNVVKNAIKESTDSIWFSFKEHVRKKFNLWNS